MAVKIKASLKLRLENLRVKPLSDKKTTPSFQSCVDFTHPPVLRECKVSSWP